MKLYVSPQIQVDEFANECVLSMSGGQIGDVFGTDGDGMF